MGGAQWSHRAVRAASGRCVRAPSRAGRVPARFRGGPVRSAAPGRSERCGSRPVVVCRPVVSCSPSPRPLAVALPCRCRGVRRLKRERFPQGGPLRPRRAPIPPAPVPGPSRVLRCALSAHPAAPSPAAAPPAPPRLPMPAASHRPAAPPRPPPRS